MHSISIVGTGLIGASIGKVLTNAFFVKGFDRNEKNAKIALKIGAINEISQSIKEVANADLIIISIPVQFIPRFIMDNLTNFKEGSIVMDTGSTKEAVIYAMEKLPESVQFVGGHPIAGKEKSGPVYADSQLFKNKMFVLTEENRLSSEGKVFVLDVVRKLYAVPYFINCEKHDEILAYASHFPYLASSALFEIAHRKELGFPDIFKFAGSGLRDVTRIASGDVEMSLGMLQTNRENVLKVLSEYINILEEFSDKLRSGKLKKALEEIKGRRDKVWK